MKKAINILILWAIPMLISAAAPLYMNPAAPTEDRLHDLMQRMTIEDKIGQMCQYVGLHHLKQVEERQRSQGIDPTSDAFGFYRGLTSDDVKDLVLQGRIGSFLHVEDFEEVNDLQKLAEQSDLKIPLLMGIDAIHGHGLYGPGATIFPSPISLSVSWDTTMVTEIAKITAREMRATGYHWTFSPNVDVARDPRWGRVGETFGEDPWLVSLMGAAMIKGYQGDLNQDDVLACAKHFIAGSQPLRGLNFSPMDASERSLREIWFPPYQTAVKQGCYTLMAAHNELNGFPCHASDYLLTDMLRTEWGFQGFVVSDWTDIDRIYSLHHLTETRKDADILSVQSGMDMHMHGPLFYDHILAGVQEGRIPESRVNEAAGQILLAKFKLGLFEKRYVKEKTVQKTILAKKHQDLALEAALKSMVLLKNDKSLLPLNPSIGSLFITGPNADNGCILGDWVMQQPEDNIITLLEGIKNRVSENTQIRFQPMQNMRDITDEEIENAVEMASQSETAVIAVGENSIRYDWNNRTNGENAARASLNLFGRQLELIQKIHATGTPVVVVLLSGRPLALPWCKAHVPAILAAWEPGMAGGKAIAMTLFGDHNPSGKLTLTFPQSTGQIPCFYNHKPSAYYRRFVDEETEFLFPFGHGLSYTEFTYSNLTVNPVIKNGSDVNITVTLTNSGKRDGEEVVLAFVNDEVSSVTTPVKELKAFKRISLKAGQSKQVSLTIKADQLALLDKNFNRIVEPGTFEISIAGLSRKFKIQ